MSKKTIFLFLIICCCFATNASAGALFTNTIELLEDSIIFTVHEVYTDEDALTFKEDLDKDGSGSVDFSEIEAFRQRYLSNGGAQFLEYVLMNNGSLQLTIDSIDLQFKDAEGPVNNSSMTVTTMIQYSSEPIVSGEEYSLWVLGHPLIDNMRFVLPADMKLISYDGLDNSSKSVENGHVVLEGVSGIRSFMIDDRPAFEYAVLLKIQKKSFYEHRLFLPLLILVEVLLAATALYIIRHNKNK